MTSRVLGRLESVERRAVWTHEARSFTPWLLKNADVLGEVLGMDLVLSGAEHSVGGFLLDLIGVDESTNERVIIENQLDGTDHIHLGQLLTYACGTYPTNIVWIAAKFREEHRAALDWLNSRADEDTRFFGVELNVVRIGCPTQRPGYSSLSNPTAGAGRSRRVHARSLLAARGPTRSSGAGSSNVSPSRGQVGRSQGSPPHRAGSRCPPGPPASGTRATSAGRDCAARSFLPTQTPPSTTPRRPSVTRWRSRTVRRCPSSRCTARRAAASPTTIPAGSTDRRLGQLHHPVHRRPDPLPQGYRHNRRSSRIDSADTKLKQRGLKKAKQVDEPRTGR